MLQTTTVSGTSPILVPVDLSAASYEALLFATQLAVDSSRSLVILHVVHDDIQRPNTYPRRNEIEQMLPIEEIAERVFRDFVADLCKQYPDNAVLANAELMLVRGLPATRITEVAHQTGAGHIVMSGNRRTSLSKLLMGSVVERVIQHCTVPVTIVNSGNTVLTENGVDAFRCEPAVCGD